MELQVHGDEGEKVTILDVGRATLEISNPRQVDMIDLQITVFEERGGQSVNSSQASFGA